jgi:hypothetical protein
MLRSIFLGDTINAKWDLTMLGDKLMLQLDELSTEPE